MGRIADLVKEARRRRVFRMIALYIVGVWVLLQVADVLFPALDIPESSKLYIVTAAIVCFPIAVIFGWRYDLTRTGLVRTLPANADESQNLALQRADYLTLTALTVIIVVVGFGIGGEIVNQRTETPARTSPSTASDKSIAVLPFQNMTGGTEEDYFSDGISEEILNALARIDGVKLVGRSSSFRFRGSQLDLREIGQQLGVANILEGSVRRRGNELRISAELINVSNGFSLWRQVYERQLVDVFDIQEEIARAISTTLEATLELSDPSGSERTANLDAYNAYLLANHLAEAEKNEAAKEAYLEAIELDPEFAPPYYGYVWTCMATWGPAVSEECKDRVEPFMYKMQQLAPDSPKIDIGFAMVYDLLDKNFPASREALERAYKLHPDDVTVLRNFAYVLAFQWGELRRAAEMYSRVMDMEPLFHSPRLSFAQLLTLMGRHHEALGHIEKAREIASSPWNDWVLAQWHFSQLQYAEGLRASYQAIEEGQLPYNMAEIALELEDIERARFWSARMTESIPGTFTALQHQFQVSFANEDHEAALGYAERLSKIDLSPTELEWTSLASAQWRKYLQRSNQTAALVAYTRNFPNLFKDKITIGEWNYSAAVGLAELLLAQGDEQSASRLLELVDTYLTESSYNRNFAQVAVYVLLDDPNAALNALDAALRANYRFGWWMLEKDPLFEPLWSEPRFQRVMSELRVEMAFHLDNIRKQEESGQLKPYNQIM